MTYEISRFTKTSRVEYVSKNELYKKCKLGLGPTINDGTLMFQFDIEIELIC